MPASPKILAVAGGLAIAAAVAVAIAIRTIDAGELARPLVARAAKALGRDVTVGGRIEIRLGLEPALVLGDVRVANAPWAQSPQLLTAKRIEARAKLWPLLNRRLELTRLELVEPVIVLETDAQGRGSWESGPASEGAPRARADEGPPGLGVANVAVVDGRLAWRDAARGADTTVAIEVLSLSARDASSPIAAELRGSVDGVTLVLAGKLDPVAALADRRVPYAFSVSGEAAGRKVAVAARLHRTDDAVAFDDLAATVGGSSVKGRVEIRGGGAHPAWTVALASPSLSVADLPFVRAKPDEKAKVATGPQRARLFPDTPVPLDRLQDTRANGEATIDRLTLADGRRLDHVRMRFALRDAVLDVPEFRMAAYGGSVSGSLRLDAQRGRPPTLALRVDGRGVDLGALLAAAGIMREVRGGKTEIAIDLRMRGSSPHEWAASATGQVRAVAGPATLANTKLDTALSFDRLAEAVNPFHARTDATELRCAVVRLPLANGVASVDRTIALETAQMDVSASGTLDFRAETLDLAIRPRIRQGIPIDIPQIADLVRFRGPFDAPAVVVDSVASAATIARIGGAVATGGLSAVGEALLSGATRGPGACDVALGKGAPAADGSRGAARQASPQSPVDGLGRALERLLKR